jgi:hypothetical protein
MLCPIFTGISAISQLFAPNFFGQNPRTRGKRRFVANVLQMPAFEFRPPIARFILVEIDNFSLHGIWGV